MKVLVACEESQTVCKEFRIKGHEAYSCDILPCSGGHPEWHIQGDALREINSRKYHLIISFPPCTDLSLSGARWFEKKRLSGEQEQSILFFAAIMALSDATENPVNIFCGGKYIKKWFPIIHKELTEQAYKFKPTQIIQPWQFGHGETKKTCLWIHEKLNKLKPTDIVDGRDQRIWKMPPSEDRGKLRSKTYIGIAKAMAEQWS